METIRIGAGFWVTAESWPALADWFSSRIESSWSRSSLAKLTQELRERKPAVFLDTTNLSGKYIGDLALKPEEWLSKSDMKCRVLATSWNLDGFVIELWLDEEQLKVLPATQRSAAIKDFVPVLQAMMKAELATPPFYLSSLEVVLDESLAHVGAEEKLPEYLATWPGEGKFLDLYQTKESPIALFAWSPQTLTQTAHVLVGANRDVLRALLRDATSQFWHDGLRKHIDFRLNAAEEQAQQALELGDKLELLAAKPLSIKTLLPGPIASRIDVLPELSDCIIRLNESVKGLQDAKRTLAEVRIVYDNDFVWSGSKLVLLQPGVSRGRLVQFSDDDIGELSLTAYLKRSSLRIIDFYDQRIDLTSDRIQKLLDSFQTLLSVRSTQQSALLNRLVLVLTVLSAFLASLQVLSAFEFWQEHPQRLVAFVFFVVLITCAAVWWLGRSRPSTS